MTTAAISYASPEPPLSVTDLLRRAGAGDQAAWEEILCRYNGLVVAKARSFRLQEADVLDAVQTTWLRLAENVHRVRDPECLPRWLATTAGRECLCILRQAKHTSPSTEAVLDNVADPSVSPEQRIIDADTAQTLRNLVAELPSRHQSVLRALFTDHPRPYAELARTIGIPTGSIGPIRGRALRQLQRMIRECGIDDPRHRPRPHPAPQRSRQRRPITSTSAIAPDDQPTPTWKPQWAGQVRRAGAA